MGLLVLRYRARTGALTTAEVADVTDVLKFSCFRGPHLGADVPNDLVQQGLRRLVAQYGDHYAPLVEALSSV